MNIFNKTAHQKDDAASRREKWLAELRQIKRELDANEALFNMTDDFDLTDYVIHEKTALEARYSYLIRLIRTYDEAAATALASEVPPSEPQAPSSEQQLPPEAAQLPLVQPDPSPKPV